jgi:hypothetical protein
MKKYLLPCMMATAILSFNSCTEEEDPIVEGNSSGKLKHVHIERNLDILDLDLTYDSDGNLISSGIFTLTWSSSSVDISQAGASATLPRDGAGYVSADAQGTVFGYDSDGNLTQRGGDTYTYSNGDCVRYVEEGGDYYIDYTYLSTLDNRDAGLKYMPAVNQVFALNHADHVLSSMVVTSINSGDTSTTTVDYEYTYDAENRIVSVHSISPDDSDWNLSATYTYHE